MSAEHVPTIVSLLWPDDVPQNDATLASSDLDLGVVVEAMALHRGYRPFVESVLRGLCPDPAVITYRQDVLDDLLGQPELVARLETMLGNIQSLDHFPNVRQWRDNVLQQVIYRLGELSSYVDTLSELDDILTGTSGLRSMALKRLREAVHKTTHTPLFQSLKTELPHLLSQVQRIASVTIGINLDHNLKPAGATLLSINTEKFTGESSFLERLFNRGKSGYEGIGPLHERRKVNGAFLPLEQRDDAVLQPLFKDLSKVLNRVSTEVNKALRHYTRIDVGFLLSLENEIAYYLGAARLVKRLRDCHLPVCRPDIAPMIERVCVMTASYNVNLALRLSQSGNRDLSAEVVSNDVAFDDNGGRIFILTGPNRGGKTTYLRAVGLAQVLMQAGLYVPAESARMSPVDGIYSHFATQERADLHTGRLGEESQRLSAIFARATRHSLILLNESLASTSAGEGVYIASDIIRAMRLLGMRAIYATHLHELAADCKSLNASVDGDSAIASLVALVDTAVHDDEGMVQRTYKIVPAPPMGKSYAREIAARYGISFEQLTGNQHTTNPLPPE